ncbi:MAG: PAS domain-containing protein [Deltaproteobacteria bacterium]|nr:PAS domain-containing protein [Deltaproteobacteria bacterium]
MGPSDVAQLLEALPDATAVLGTDGKIGSCNRGFRDLFGSAAGRTVLELTRDADAGHAVVAALAGQQRRLEVTLPVARRTLLLFFSPMPSGALLTARDITEAKRMERARRDFVANASHELRTPVTAICGAAETLLNGAVDDPDAALGFVEMISRHADRLSRLTQELLDLSRIESGEWQVQLTPLEVSALAAGTFDLLRQRAEDKKLQMRNLIAPDLRVLGDRRALEQVLVNLLDNAVKYTPAQGAVTLEGVRDGNWVTLSITDTGPGIDRHHLGRLFERFYRVDSGRARDAGGTGLGLSIVKHLMQAMGGEVGVDSDRTGSRFWVRLPAAA